MAKAVPTGKTKIASFLVLAFLFIWAIPAQAATVIISSDFVKTAYVHLSSSDIKALNSSPVTLLSAPCGTCRYVIEDWEYNFNYGTTQYVSGGHLLLEWTSGTSINQIADTNYTAAASRWGRITMSSVNDTGTQLGTAIRIKTITSDPTVGDGTMDIWIHYRLLDPSVQSPDYDIPSTDGSSGQVLETDGSANLSWETSSGGSSLPADADGYLRNNGSGTLTWDNASTIKTFQSLSNVENTALSTWVGTTNITTLGTIGTGVWNGTIIDDTYLDLTGPGFPADAEGFLHNDGLGVLAWTSASAGDTIVEDNMIDGIAILLYFGAFVLFALIAFWRPKRK